MEINGDLQCFNECRLVICYRIFGRISDGIFSLQLPNQNTALIQKQWVSDWSLQPVCACCGQSFLVLWGGISSWVKHKSIKILINECWWRVCVCVCVCVCLCTIVGKKQLVLNFFRPMEQVYVPKNRMKDISVISGTYSQADPTSWPPHSIHSGRVKTPRSRSDVAVRHRHEH